MHTFLFIVYYLVNLYEVYKTLCCFVQEGRCIMSPSFGVYCLNFYIYMLSIKIAVLPILQ